MSSVMSQHKLEEMFDRFIREVTEQTGGIRLRQDLGPPDGDLCTVYIEFTKGFHTSLSLCVDAAMLARMAQQFLQTEDVTQQDLEDFGKEYFNILCGRIASELFQATQVSSRFSVPFFYFGRYEPEGYTKQFSLNYSSDRREGVQLTHHVPYAGGLEYPAV